MSAISNESLWIIPDLSSLAGRHAQEFKLLHGGDAMLLALMEGDVDSLDRLEHGFVDAAKVRSCRKAAAICSLTAAAHGFSGHVEQIITQHTPFLSFPQSSLLSERSPASLAWAWTELDANERALAPAMPPQMLCKWLSGSFSHPESGLPMGAELPTVAYEMGRSFGPAGEIVRRAMRAKTLVSLLKPNSQAAGQQRDILDFCSAMSSPALIEAPGLAKIKKVKSAVQAKKRALGALAGGVGGSLASALLPIAAPAAAAAAPIALGAFALLALGAVILALDPSDRAQSPYSKKYFATDSLVDFVSECYPDLASAGVFATWQNTRGYVEVDAYRALELLGVGTIRSLGAAATPAPLDPKAPLPIGGPNMSKIDMFSLMASRIERDALNGAAMPPPAAAARRASRL